MRFLIDTHILIWMLEGERRLSKSRRELLSDPTNQVFVSVVSLWEIAIKTGTGKLSISKPLFDIVNEVADSSSILLGVEPMHPLAVSTLPFHHRDPFDRMLIAQSQVEFLNLMSDDEAFPDYLSNLF